MASVSVEAGVGPSGAPIATVILSDWGTVTVKVSRIVAGRETVVRGGRALDVLGAGSLVDFEVPLGVSVAYVVESVADRVETTVTVPSGVGWLTDPCDPEVAVSFGTRTGLGADLVMLSGMVGSVSRAADTSTVSVIGADLPVAVGGVRMRGASVPMSFAALSEAAAEKMDALLEGGSTIVVRPPADLPILDPVSYVALPDVTVTPLDAGRGGHSVTFEGDGTLVRPFTSAVAWTFWTYQSTAATYVTQAGAALTYAQVQTYTTSAGYTYADAVRDPKLGGAIA